MDLSFKLEQPEDYRSVEELTREAFFNHNVPGCCEHYLAHILRRSPSFIPQLDFVAWIENKIVGNIMYTSAMIQKDNGEKMSVLSFGPVSVLPSYQGKGIGSALVNYTKELARKMGYKAILIFGDFDFYKHFGFTRAEDYKIGTSWHTYADSLLACELEAEALNNCAGLFFEDKAFDIDEEKAQEFDKTFPPKEKLTGLPSQQKFAEQVKKNKVRKR